MSIAPTLSWQNNKLPKYKNYLFLFMLMSLLTLIVSFFSTFNPWGFVGILLSSIIISSSILSLYYNYNKYGLKKFITNNNALIAHIGVGIMILGITCSSIFQTEFNYTFSNNEIKMMENIHIN